MGLDLLVPPWSCFLNGKCFFWQVIAKARAPGMVFLVSNNFQLWRMFIPTSRRRESVPHSLVFSWS